MGTWTQRRDSDTRREEGRREQGEWRVTRMLTLPCVRQIAVGSCCVSQGSQTWLRKSWRGGMGREEGGVQEGGDTCLPSATSSCMAETSTILYGSYPSITNK